MTPTLLSYSEASVLVLEQAQRIASTSPRRIERIPLLHAIHRVLAAPVLADRHHPPFDRSTRDGYAVQAASLATGSSIPVLGTLRAGEPAPTEALHAGTALEIMTGAPVPEGADAVVMLEHVEAPKESSTDQNIRLQTGRTLRRGDNIVRTGSEAHQGDLLIAAGTRLAPPHIAALAAVGAIEVDVFTRPRVAILATGDELVEIERNPLPHQIRNSNSATLAAQVVLAGGQPERLGIAEDNLEHLRARLDRAADGNDLLLLSGGVSAGKYDLVEQVLAERGASFHFTGVRIQPGKPAVFGELPVAAADDLPSARPGSLPLPFFGLPGNPVSTMVTFLLFAAPLLRTITGDTAPAPRFAQARLARAETAASGITRFLPARITGGWNNVQVERIPWQGSGDLAATAQSNCFVVFPPDTALEAGATVQVLLP